MKKLLFITLLIPLFLSGCSKEGCRDASALNFDAEADKDGECRYTRVIFYAPSNRVGGTADLVEKIEIFLGPTPNEELMGTITTFNHSSPSGCITPEGAFEYELTNGDVNTIFLTRYYYDNGSNEAGGSFGYSASSTQECIDVSLTL